MLWVAYKECDQDDGGGETTSEDDQSDASGMIDNIAADGEHDETGERAD
jgi:hypothetical protein